MKDIPMQLVVVQLENGRRGVFFGAPIVADDDSELDCQVEQVFFSNVNRLPDGMSLDELSQLAMAQFEQGGRPMH